MSHYMIFWSLSHRRASSEGSGETAHMRSPLRAFAALTHKEEANKNAQTNCKTNSINI